jgi:IS30 family transposase
MFLTRLSSPNDRHPRITNGLIRQYLPKGTDLSLSSQARLTFIERRLNGRRRKVHNRKTPDEVYRVAVHESAPVWRS